MSFYGGRPGTSFIVKKTFLSLDEMYTAFKKGPDYTEVWYGEYCVVDTPNKNDPDNGKIFRRGVNYTHTATASDGTVYHDGGAEYLGQFVGTSSGTPFFSMGALNDVVAKSQMDVDTSVWQEKAYPIAYNESTGTFDVYHDTDNEGDDPDIGVFSFAADNASGMLVPGKDVDEDGNVTYNDDLKWTWCNVRSADTNNDSWFYVGFQIPYPVVEISSQTFFPYDEDGKYDDTSTCTRDDDGTHAFYRHYTITVPKGIKGESITNVHKVIVAEGDNFYTADDVSYENGKLVLSAPSYKGSEHIGDAILTYDILCYDDTDTPEAVSIYLCDYVIVDKAYMYDDGAITFFTNYNDRIDLVYADATGAIIYDEDGSPKVFRIKFVEDVKLSTDDELMEDKRIQIKYNTEQLYEAIGDEINYVQEIVINPEDFHLLVLFNDRTHRFNLDSINLGQYTVDDDGVYTDDSGCKWRRAVDLTNASSSIQGILGWNTEVNAYATTDSDVVQDTFWRDYGSVKDDAGLMVGLNVPTNDVWEYLGKTGYNLENDDVVDFLNTRYEGGLTGLNSGSSSLVGKMVTVGDGDNDKRFYAYDYQQNTWYFLGQIGYETLDAAVVSADGDSDDNPSIGQKDYYNVTKNGVIAVERDDDVDTSGVPRPWTPSYNEWNDDKFQTTGLVRDVLVGNDSVTDSGVATINLLSSTDTGVVNPSGLTGLEATGDGALRVADPTTLQITSRAEHVAVTCATVDKAIEHAFESGAVGSLWYDEEAGEYQGINSWFTLMRDHKVYSVDIPWYEYSTSPACVKTDANAALEVEPSTATYAGKDDYAGVHAFDCFRCNGWVDDDGMPHVSAIEGFDDRYTTTPDVPLDVWVMTPVLYWRMHDLGNGYQRLSISDSPQPGFSLQPGAKVPDGRMRPYILYAAYCGGKDSEGRLRSCAGLPVFNRTLSLASLINTIAPNRGSGYSGLTVVEIWYQRIMSLLKYATKAVKSVYSGCVLYNVAASLTKAESPANRVIIQSADAAKYKIGCYVSIGSNTITTTDRDQKDTYDIIDNVKVLSKESIDDSNVALYLDTQQIFDTATTYSVFSSPYGSGFCDQVMGRDGAASSPLYGTEPFKLQNIEFCLGAYELESDVICKTLDECKVYVCTDCTRLSTDVTDNYKLVGEIGDFTIRNMWNYVEDYVLMDCGLIAPKGFNATTSTGAGVGFWPTNKGTIYKYTTIFRHNGALTTSYYFGGMGCISANWNTNSPGWATTTRLSATGRRL